MSKKRVYREVDERTKETIAKAAKLSVIYF